MERKSDKPLSHTPWISDVKALLKKWVLPVPVVGGPAPSLRGHSPVSVSLRSPSFMLSTLGFTTVAFVTGALALWAPSYLMRARTVLYKTEPFQNNYDDR